MSYINFLTAGSNATITTKYNGSVKNPYSQNSLCVEIGGICTGHYMYLYATGYHPDTNSVGIYPYLAKEGVAPFTYFNGDSNYNKCFFVASTKKIDLKTALSEIPIQFWYAYSSGGDSYVAPYCIAGYMPGDTIFISNYVRCDSSSSQCTHTAYASYSIDGVQHTTSDTHNHSGGCSTYFTIPEDNIIHDIKIGSQTPSTPIYYNPYNPLSPGKSMPWVNVNGQLKRAVSMWVNVNGQLKEI